MEGRFDLIMDCAEPGNAVKRSKNRRDYRWVANTLKKIQKYDGGIEVAHELAQKYVAEYPRRTSLIDELRRFWNICLDAYNYYL